MFNYHCGDDPTQCLFVYGSSDENDESSIRYHFTEKAISLIETMLDQGIKLASTAELV